ncbi:hypothetical protein, partial [uncultured Ruegeria sp.]|uniref:hypothetical protein n=1 Tax=uncultured Ruegeria sp. TaxID=259304 RepID=UPI002616C5B4
FDKGIESALHASIKEEFFNKIRPERTLDPHTHRCSAACRTSRPAHAKCQASQIRKIRTKLAFATLTPMTAFGFYEALLHKWWFERTSPFPGRIYPTGSVT